MPAEENSSAPHGYNPTHKNASLLRFKPRRSLLFRSDAWKQKLIAANVTQVITVIALEPGFNEALLSRSLVASQHQNLRGLIVLNKNDLVASQPQVYDQIYQQIRSRLEMFNKLGIPIIEISAIQDVQHLLPWLKNQNSILLGQSGMGKSTIVNSLIPQAQRKTQEISTTLNSGKHTTTYTRLYNLDNPPTASKIIDSPGLHSFGLHHLTLGDVELAFPEIRQLFEQQKHCRFQDCRHINEPGCQVKNLVASGQMHPRRYEHFLAICRKQDGN